VFPAVFRARPGALHAGTLSRANLAHVRQPRPDHGLGFQEKVLNKFRLFLFRSGADLLLQKHMQAGTRVWSLLFFMLRFLSEADLGLHAGTEGRHARCVQVARRRFPAFAFCVWGCGLKNNHSTEMCSGSESGSYVRLTGSCIALGPSWTCNKNKNKKEAGTEGGHARCVQGPRRCLTAFAFCVWGFGFKNNHSTEMCSSSEAGSYLRFTDSCITQLKAQGPAWTCNKNKEEEAGTEGGHARRVQGARRRFPPFAFCVLGFRFGC